MAQSYPSLAKRTTGLLRHSQVPVCSLHDLKALKGCPKALLRGPDDDLVSLDPACPSS
jgi:hypothetical protein